jgi:hypothetical protein
MTRFEGPPPWLLENLATAGDSSQPFEDRVRAADLATRQVQQYLADIIVTGMVVEGRSWADVGRVLGVTRQAAFQRFASHVPQGGHPS